MLQPPKKSGKWIGAGVLAVAVTAGAKSVGALKGVSVAFLGLFSHGGGTQAVIATQVASHAGQATALLPAGRELPTLSTTMTRVAVQVLVRTPGQEREQLSTLVGEQRDKFLVLVVEQDIKAAGLRSYLRGPFRDWAPDTVAAWRHLGEPTKAALLDEARSLPPDADRWATLEREFRALTSF